MTAARSFAPKRESFAAPVSAIQDHDEAAIEREAARVVRQRIAAKAKPRKIIRCKTRKTERAAFTEKRWRASRLRGRSATPHVWRICAAATQPSKA
jgi:hypothetical protein